MISLPSFSTIQNRNVNLPIIGSVSLVAALALGAAAYLLLKRGKKSSVTKTIKTNFRK